MGAGRWGGGGGGGLEEAGISGESGGVSGVPGTARERRNNGLLTLPTRRGRSFVGAVTSETASEGKARIRTVA